MTTNNIPGYAAEASLYRTNNRHLSPIHQRLEQDGRINSILPALGYDPESGQGVPRTQLLAECIQDCRDMHPSWTISKCRNQCLSSGGGPILPRKCTDADYQWQTICHIAQDWCYSEFGLLGSIVCSQADCDNLGCVP
jgi:hypothetical protein